MSIHVCNKCGGLYATENLESFSGKPCECNEEYLRGHRIKEIDGQWYYCDTGELTVGNVRSCGHCGMENTPEGHDGCLGTLPLAMNACCGHGREDEAYVQFESGYRVSGEEAIKIMKKLKAERT